MNRIKIVKHDDLRKDHARILEPLEHRVRDIVADILTGTEAHLSRELHGIGLEVMRAVMELEILQVVGPKGKHHNARRFNRWGTNPGSVVINGAKVACEVPRVIEGKTRTAYRLKSYELFRQTGDLIKRAYTDLIRGISTRRYAEGVESFVEGYGVSAASMSRHMVRATTKKVEELFSRSLADVDLAVLMLDGIAVGDHTVVIALGIDTKGIKHILGLRQGGTENTDVVKALLQDIIERGISSERPPLVVIDGGKALRRAVLDVFGVATPIQRCTVHKKRNVLSHLPQKHHAWVSTRLKQAHDQSKYNTAHKMLVDLAEQLDRTEP